MKSTCPSYQWRLVDCQILINVLLSIIRICNILLNESQYYNAIRSKQKIMKQISIISLKPYKTKNDSPHALETNNSVHSQEDYEVYSKIKPQSPQTTITTPLQHSLSNFQNQEYGSWVANEKIQTQSIQSILVHQSQGRVEAIACCFCKKQLARRKNLIKHLRQKHTFDLLSDKYLTMRKFLADSYQYTVQQYFNEHKELIKRLQNAQLSSLPIPQEINVRMTKKFVNEIKQKYEDFKVTFEPSQIQFYKISRCKQRVQDNLLGMKSLQSLKCLILRYFIDFQRYFQIFIKNISLSELIPLFLYVFAQNLPRYNAKFLNYELMQLFTSVLLHFEDWINKHYEEVFILRKIFYYHIKIGKDDSYCERERTWKIDVLIQEYLRYIKRSINSMSELKLANFIIICFHQYILLEGLDVQ